MIKDKIKSFMIKNWYVPILSVGLVVATAVTATTNHLTGYSIYDLWTNGDNPNHPMNKPLQSGGDKVLKAELFNPTLEEFISKKMRNNNASSGLLYDKGLGAEPPPYRIAEELTEFSDMIEHQYFFKYAQHAKLKGEHADSIRKGTSGKGDIWISTRLDKIHPVTISKSTKAQCADIHIRFTHFDVPRKSYFGGPDESVTFWQDFHHRICHGVALNEKKEV